MNEMILGYLVAEYPVTYNGKVELLDENGNPHLFYMLEAYNSTMWADVNGQLWMSEAEMSRGLEVAQGTLHNAISRYMSSPQGQAIGRQYKLYSRDTAGRNVLLRFYNESTFAAVIARMQSSIPESALKFIEDREKIISTVRWLMHEHILQLAHQNDQLTQQIEDKSQVIIETAFENVVAASHLHDLQMELEEARQRAEAAEKALADLQDQLDQG